MNCETCLQSITACQDFVNHSDLDDRARAHLTDCESCREQAKEWCLLKVLRGLPAGPAETVDEGYVARSINKALNSRARRQRQWYWPATTAASLLLAAFMGLQLMTQPTAQLHQRETGSLVTATPSPATTKPVSVLLNAPQTIEQAVITVHLDDNLRMAGYPEGAPLTWATQLKAGANKLTLPIQFLNGQEGQVTVTLEYRETRKSLEIPVSHIPGQQRPDTGTGAGSGSDTSADTGSVIGA